MANVFLDANVCLRLLEGQLTKESEVFDKHQLFISGLTIHIACYVHKLKIPNQKIKDFFRFFTVVPLSSATFQKSLDVPTHDYEDNLQLNSALDARADYFVTLDKELLLLKKIEKVHILTPLQLE